MSYIKCTKRTSAGICCNLSSDKCSGVKRYKEDLHDLGFTLKSSSLIGSSEPRGALRPPVAFGTLVSTATCSTETRGDPKSDNEAAPESEEREVKPGRAGSSRAAHSPVQ